MERPLFFLNSILDRREVGGPRKPILLAWEK